MAVFGSSRTGGHPYRGADRRLRSAAADVPLPWLPVLGTVVVVCLGVGSPALFLVHSRGSLTLETSYLALASGVVGIVAGAASLVAWRISGRALYGRFGVALVVYGILELAVGGLSSFGLGPAPAAMPLDRVLAAAIPAYLLWRAATGAEVDASFAPFRSLVAAVGAGVAGLGVLTLVQSMGLVPASIASRGGEEAAQALAGALWLGAAVVGVGAGARRGSAMGVTWAWLVAGLLGVAHVVAVPATAGSALLLISSVLALIATSAAFGCAMGRVQMLLRHDNGDRRHLHQVLDATRHEIATEHLRLEEWLHDLRNAVAGINAASSVLQLASGQGPAFRTALASSLGGELTRLQRMIDPRAEITMEDVSLDEVVTPVAETERSLGAHIDVRVGDVRGRADPQALGRVVQNILANARRHAPGSRVTVSAVELRDSVSLWIHDDGPGIPLHDRAAVFQRGRSGSRGIPGGSGLGLFVAKELMHAMGGAIRVADDGSLGCTFVLSLPPAHCDPLDVASGVPAQGGGG